MTEGSRYRRLYANEWHHPAFRRLNDGARVVRFYVTAGPQTTSVGCFRLSTAVGVEDLGGTAEQFEESLGVVCDAFGWAWDPLARVIWIRDWFDSNPPASPNVVASWAKLLKNVPDCAARDEAIASITVSLKNLPGSFREPFQELSKSFRRTEVRSEVHSETNQGAGSRDQRSGKQRIREQAPTGERKRAEIGNGFSGEPIPSDVLTMARKTVTFCGKNTGTDDLTEAFYELWNQAHEGKTANRDHVQQALHDALQQRRTM